MTTSASGEGSSSSGSLPNEPNIESNLVERMVARQNDSQARRVQKMQIIIVVVIVPSPQSRVFAVVFLAVAVKQLMAMVVVVEPLLK